MLCSNEMDLIVTQYLNGNTEWEPREVSVLVSGITINIIYFYNISKNFVVIPSPLAVKEVTAGDAAEPSYESTIHAIMSDLIPNNSFGIGCSLLGKGGGERHYIALYKERGVGGQITVFDSKISSANRFFSSSESPTIFEKAWAFFTAPFKAFVLWAFDIGKQEKTFFLDENVTLHRLATQPFFDGVSCGFHSSGAVLKMIDSINDGKETTEDVTCAITNDKTLDLKAENSLNNKSEIIPGMSTALHSLILDGGRTLDNSDKALESLATECDVLNKDQKVVFSDVNGSDSDENLSGSYHLK